jgi:hypothetical protein
MNPDNAIVPADRPVVILDWEEACIGGFTDRDVHAGQRHMPLLRLPIPAAN